MSGFYKGSATHGSARKRQRDILIKEGSVACSDCFSRGFSPGKNIHTAVGVVSLSLSYIFPHSPPPSLKPNVRSLSRPAGLGRRS